MLALAIGTLVATGSAAHASEWQSVASARRAAVHAMSASARDMQQPSPQDRKVTLTVRNMPIRDALSAVAKEAGLSVLYETHAAALGAKTSAEFSETPVREAISTLLAGTGYRAVLAKSGQALLISKASQDARTAEDGGTITGRVVDSASGKGIAGVVVTVVGTKLSATTNTDGSFTLHNVPAGEHDVMVRLLGYRPSTRTVRVIADREARANFVIVPSATVISGVVTTATGQQRRLEVGSDITTINVDSVMQTAPITSVTDLLEARVPGLTVIRSTGTPGDPARLRLRGAASIQGSNDPIVIVDGVRMYYSGNNANGANIPGTGTSFPRPSPLDQIDPNTIATIDVFKGPSASALYGSDAANGVIVITTKRGQPGPTHWSLTANLGTSAIPGSYPTIAYGFGHFPTGGGSPLTTCDAGGVPDVFTLAGGCIVDSVVAFQALNDSRFTPLTRGGSGGVSATVSGGVSALRYSFTGSTSNEQGMVKLPEAAHDQYVRFVDAPPPSWMIHPDDYRMWAMSGQLSATLSPKADVTVNNQLSSSEQQRSSLGLTGVGQLIGNFVDTTRLGTTALLNGFAERGTAATTTSMTSGTLNWQPLAWLHVNVVGGLNQNQKTDKTFIPSGLPVQVVSSTDTSGSYGIVRSNANVKTGTLAAVMQIPLPGERYIRLATGFNGQNTSTGSSRISTKSVPRGVTDPNSFDITPTGETSVSSSSDVGSTYGWYIEPQLQLSSRFFFSPGIRLDGGSASGSNAGFTGFPKMSASWIALDNGNVDDNAMLWRRILTTLRLRGAYGYAGVQPGPVDRLRLFRETPVSLDGTGSTDAAVVSSLGNTHLRPERSRELEMGVDVELLDSRLSMTATYYTKKRIDAIVSTPVAPSVGGGPAIGVMAGSGASLSSYRANLGNIRNTGVEFTASAQLVRSAPLQWDVNMAAASRSNKLLTLNKGFPSAPGDRNSRLVVGYPLDGIWVRPLVGYSDLNQDGIIWSNEIILGDSAVYLGTQDPTFSSSFGTTIALLNGRLSFSTLFNYDNGVTQYNAIGMAELRSAANTADPTFLRQAILAASMVASASGSLGSQFLYQTVNTLRWNSASLRYTMPTSFARALRGRALSVSVQGSNLWLHTNYRGKDPNVNATLSGEGVSDFGQIPQPRTWVLRVNLTN
jgi:TonB-dependent SusC/RagA subfamily outer membrane receptor